MITVLIVCLAILAASLGMAVKVNNDICTPRR